MRITLSISPYLQEVLNCEILELNYKKNIIGVVLEYLYTEKIKTVKLSPIDIIHLFKLISILKIDNIVFPLKKYYAELFFSYPYQPDLLNL